MSRLFGWLGASTPPPADQARWRAVLPPGLAGGCLGLLFLVAGLAPTGFSPTGPFQVGEQWGLGEQLAARGVTVTTEPGIGYDGQWYLALAYDPLLLRQDLTRQFDNPRYRAGRPLQGWLGWLLAAGRPGAIPLALLALGPLAVGVGCAATARILSAFGRSPAWGLGFALVPGVWAGVALVTAEPLGLALAALGLSLVLDRRVGLAGLAFAGAALTKETYLAFAVAAGLHLLLDRSAAPPARLRAAALALVPGLAGLGGWWLYLVTLTGTTGARAEVSTALTGLAERSRRHAPGVPLYAGFGISTPAQAAAAAVHTDGVVVGSRAVQVAEEGPSALRAYVSSLRAALS